MAEIDVLPPAPKASSSKQFEWSCKCLNVTLTGLEVTSSGSKGDDKGKKKRVWLSEGAERIVHPVYVGYKQSAGPGERTSRRCYVCSSKTYLPVEAPPSQNSYVGWVDVDLAGVLYGQELQAAQDKPKLPLSDLLVSLPTPSTFGRPPPSISTPSAASTSQAIVSLLPPMPDPFFLPPPFVPSHPHLHSLVLHAVDQLKASRARLELDVTSFVEAKTKEMQQEEDRIRAEVEFLWNAYQKGPGKKEKEKEVKSVSRRSSIAPGQDKEEIKTTQPARPVVPTATSGLLGASLSANSFHAPPPNAGSYPDELPELDLSGPVNFGSGSMDDRNMAVSLMVSHLEQRKLGNAPPERVKPGRSASKGRRSLSRERPSVVKTVTEEDEPAETDSWIGLERGQAANVMEGGRTPRPTETKELKGDKPKTVKFQEPAKQQDETETVQEASAYTSSTDTEDQVFDFEELDDDTTAAADDDSRTRTQLDNKLSSTLAVDMPSHRSAWRRIEQSQSIYDSFRASTGGDGRRRSADSDSDSDDAEATPTNPSMFATSMPVHIALPKRAQSKPTDVNLEPKTSLTERPGLLVPGLRAAMREKPARGNALGLNVSDPKAEAGPVERSKALSGSTSRDRSASISGTFKQDPGAVFEALADAEDEDELGDIDDSDTRPGRPNFVPPHIQSLQDDIADSLVGWRSLAT